MARATELVLCSLPVLLSMLGVTGCPSDGAQNCQDFVGDPALPAEAGELLFTDGASKTLATVSPGSAVPLERPPQGGYVMYTSMRVRNMGGCNVSFRGQLRDIATDTVIGFDGRQAHLFPSGDGWFQPDPAQNANLPNIGACPAYGPRDVHGQTWQLELTATDKQGRTVSGSRPIVPTCMQSSEAFQYNCVCTCSANYTLGKCGFGAPDGGTDAAM